MASRTQLPSWPTPFQAWNSPPHAADLRHLPAQPRRCVGRVPVHGRATDSRGRRDEVRLAEARAAVRRHTAGAEIAVERVDTTTGSIDWHGLRFAPLATTFGIADPSPANEQLTACWEHYRTNLPPDMKIELYSNRVRVEPGAFGARADLINTIGGYLAKAEAEDQDILVGPQAHSLDHARQQFRRACALPVPDGSSASRRS